MVTPYIVWSVMRLMLEASGVLGLSLVVRMWVRVAVIVVCRVAFKLSGEVRVHLLPLRQLPLNEVSLGLLRVTAEVWHLRSTATVAHLNLPRSFARGGTASARPRRAS